MNISKAIWTSIAIVISTLYEGALILMPIIALAAYGYSLAFCVISTLIMLSMATYKNAIYFKYVAKVSETISLDSSSLINASAFPYLRYLALTIFLAFGFIYSCYLLIAYNGWLVVGILALNGISYYSIQKIYAKLITI